MKIVLLCVVALVAVIQLPREGDAVCCYGKGLLWKLRCKDCSKAAPFCAKGKSCNIFGCNCMGGCREGPCPSSYNHHAHEKPVYEAPVGRDYESSYESMPNDGDAVVPASSDYDAPVSAVLYGSELETSSSSDGGDSAYDVFSGGESEMSSKMKTPQSEVSYGSDSEMPSSYDYNTPDVDAGDEYDSHGDESESEITSADDVIKSADENGDGYMDIDEAEKFLVKRGLATSGYRAKRSLMAIDLNNDNYISAEEIELYED